MTLRVALFPLVIHQMRYTAAKMKTAGPMLAKLKVRDTLPKLELATSS